jgi:hypothetical protein
MVAGTKGTRSRRIVKKDTVTSKTGVEVGSCYCRKCMRTMPPTNFYIHTDLFLDANGYMSVCKECINSLYNKIYTFEEHNLERSILKVCRVMNIKYSPEAIVSTQKQLDTLLAKGKPETENTFGIYKTKLMMVQKTKFTDRDINEDFTFVEPSQEIKEAIAYDEIDDQLYFETNWGKGLSPDDYQFLEQEYDKWRNPEGNSQGEEVLIREICHQQNKIMKTRLEGGSTSTLVKELQDLMKNSALTPALARVSDQGKIVNTWGMITKMIEMENPAEHYDKKLYQDYFGLAKYCYNYITRPIMNFFQGTKNYELTEDDGVIIEDEPAEMNKEN